MHRGRLKRVSDSACRVVAQPWLRELRGTQLRQRPHAHARTFRASQRHWHRASQPQSQRRTSSSGFQSKSAGFQLCGSMAPRAAPVRVATALGGGALWILWTHSDAATATVRRLRLTRLAGTSGVQQEDSSMEIDEYAK